MSYLFMFWISVNTKISTHEWSLKTALDDTTSYENSQIDLNKHFPISPFYTSAGSFIYFYPSLSPANRISLKFYRCIINNLSLSSNILRCFICRRTSIVFLKAIELISFKDLRMIIGFWETSWSKFYKIPFKLIKMLPSPYSCWTLGFFKK